MNKGRREDRAPADAHGPRATRTHGAGTTGAAEVTRPSLRGGFNAYSALSRVNGLCCHPRLAISPARLDPSVAGSGPHAFAVRERSFVRTLDENAAISRGHRSP